MTDDIRRTDSASELVDIIHQVRRRWRDEAGAARRAGRRRARRHRPAAVRLRPRVVALHARRDHHLPHHRRSGAGRPDRLPAGPAAAAAAPRRAGRAYLEEHEPSLQAAIISAVEAERGRSGSPYSATLVRRLVESAVEKAASHRRRPARRARARAPLRHHARRDCSRGDRASSRSALRICGTRCRRC